MSYQSEADSAMALIGLGVLLVICIVGLGVVLLGMYFHTFL